jgi:P pilus assembly chaperone PapD
VIPRRVSGLIAGISALGSLVPAVAMSADPATPAGSAPFSLTVSPAPLTLLGSRQTTLRVSNGGDQPLNLQLSLSNYSLRRDGRPLFGSRAGARLSARTWLRLQPTRLHLDAGEQGSVRVTAAPPRQATPGDHQALVLLAAAQGSSGTFQVRHRIGVGVLVRVEGRITRRLSIGRLTVRRAGRFDVLRVRIRNLGNINERLGKGQVTVQLRRGGQPPLTFRARARSLLPGTTGDVMATRVGHRRGTYTATVRVRFSRPPDAGPGVSTTPRPLVRVVRVRL